MMQYPDELTCDMAETYGVFDIKRLPARLAATLAVGLRDTSRVKMALTGTKASDEVMLLAALVDALKNLCWNLAGADEENKPVSMVKYYLNGKKLDEPEPQEKNFEVFDSPEDFQAKWKKLKEGG
ncbi:MAG: hypothetical protein J6S50_00380 [Oscillospiraceae bacterium]|nr:hypothetical protein [Oscillospiraceae bacterium]MBO7726957.1 hypothetical protein [Oscillospiraceae bacterium]